MYISDRLMGVAVHWARGYGPLLDSQSFSFARGGSSGCYNELQGLPASVGAMRFEVIARSGDRNFMVGSNGTPNDVDGGIWRPVNGAIQAPTDRTVWTPKWNLTAGWSGCSFTSLGTTGDLTVLFGPMETDTPAPSGDVVWWDSLGPRADGWGRFAWEWTGSPNGPWYVSQASDPPGTMHVVRKNWTGERRFTVPLRSSDTVKVRCDQVDGSPATVLDLGGLSADGGGVYTLPATTECWPRWEATGGVDLRITRNPTTNSIVRYSPLYIEPLPFS